LKVVVKRGHHWELKDPKSVDFAAEIRPARTQGVGWVVANKDDGFGAQLHCKQAAFAVARHDSKCYMHKAFNKKGFHNKQMEADTFMGMSSDSLDRNGQACGGMVRGIDAPFPAEKPHPDAFYTPEVRAELRKMYDANPKPTAAVHKECQVAFHVRRGDVGSGSNKNRYTSNEELIDAINRNFADKTVCIFSEGSERGFGKLASLPKVRFHLNGDAMEAMHNMVMAPELVIAKSSYSYAAGLLNTGKVYYIKKFWHKVPSVWTQTKSSASFARNLESDSMIEPVKEGPVSDYD